MTIDYCVFRLRTMYNGYSIRTKNHETSKVVGFLGMSVGCPDKIHLCWKKCSTEYQITVVHVTMRVGTLSIWRGASHMWYMSKDFLGFIHSVLKGNIVGNLWFGYNCQFYTQKTQNWENLVISGLFKWHKFTSYPSHSAIYCVYWSKITNLSWNIIK